MQPATLNGLMSATQILLALPERAQQLLSRETILVRAIDRGTLGALHPLAPDEVLEEPEPTLSDEEKNKRFDQRLRRWLRTAPPDERIAYRLDTERVKYRAVALAALDPVMTVEQVERMGDAVDEIYLGLLVFSGLAKKPATADAEAAA